MSEMLEWDQYIHTLVGTEGWPFVVADRYLRNVARGDAPAPRRFVADLVPRLCHVEASRRLATARGLIALALQLLGRDTEAVTSVIASLVECWRDIDEDDLDGIASELDRVGIGYAFLDAVKRQPQNDVAARAEAIVAARASADSVSERGVVLFIVPLSDELRAIRLEIPDLIPHEVSSEDECFRFELTTRGGKADGVIYLVGKKGPLYATAVAARAISHWRPHVVLNVGICAGVSRDTRLCDVVVADTVDDYIANTKVRGEAFLRAGDPFNSDLTLVRRATHLEHADAQGFEQWQARVKDLLYERLQHADRARLQGLTRDAAVVHDGPMACGPFVSESEEFVRWLLSRNREYLAVDMESAGVATATRMEGQLRPRGCVIRGVSDFGDQRKGIIDEVAEQGIREVATRAAMAFSVRLVERLPDSVWRR